MIVSVVKHSYISAGPKAKGQARAHLNYIQHRSGDDRNEKGYRQFFNRDNDQVNSGWFKNQVANAPDRGTTLHKFILSPGVRGVDMQEYTRHVMEQIQSAKGVEVEWQAVVHNNTEHAHAHVVMLGKDRHGRQIRFGKYDYDRMREIGDRYLERKHEFDRYYDHSLDRLLKEGERDFDLDAFARSGWSESERKEKGGWKEKATQTKKRQGTKEQAQEEKSKRREDRELEAESVRRYDYMRPPRKPRRQRVFEARGRKDVDYFHDLYQRRMSRQQLNRLVEGDPDNKEKWEKSLAQLDELEAEKRKEIDPRVINRLLGIKEPRRPKPKQQEAAKGEALKIKQAPVASESSSGPEPGHDAGHAQSEQQVLAPTKEQEPKIQERPVKEPDRQVVHDVQPAQAETEIAKGARIENDTRDIDAEIDRLTEKLTEELLKGQSEREEKAQKEREQEERDEDEDRER